MAPQAMGGAGAGELGLLAGLGRRVGLQAWFRCYLRKPWNAFGIPLQDAFHLPNRQRASILRLAELTNTKTN